MTEPLGSTIDAALMWVEDHRVTGALEVVGDRSAGALFFHEGRACFGLLNGDSCVPATGGGIDPELWLRALESPVADIDFAASLMLAGAPARRVEIFAHNAIDNTVGMLRRNTGVRVRFTERSSPFGTMFRFELSRWIERGEADRPSRTPLGNLQLVSRSA
ncbi:MAG: hypothetical protein ACFCVC_01900 [Acidimicrobiia bacterium]